VKHKDLFKYKKFHPFAQVRQALLYRSARELCCQLQKQGHEAYFVGGAVRDLFLFPNLVPQEIDLATSASCEEIFKIFPQTQFVGKAFGVCLVHLHEFTFELTTFRKEGKYVDRRRPSCVTRANFREDSQRRDFTINALYFDPLKKRILDPQGGLKDLQLKVLRCVGIAHERLQEDALRILRLCRFAANLRFVLSSDCFVAAKQESAGLKYLSKERILLEFQKIKKGHFFIFVKLLLALIDINMLFLSPLYKEDENKLKNFKQNARVQDIKKETQFPFFNFIRTLFFLGEFKHNRILALFKEFNLWPLSAQDKKICLYFVRCLYLEDVLPKKTEIELRDFIFFDQLIVLENVGRQDFKLICLSLTFLLKNTIFSETLEKTIEKKHDLNSLLQKQTQVIIETVEKARLEKKYISAFIKYSVYLQVKVGKLPSPQDMIASKKKFFDQYFLLKVFPEK
jgi:tRNA nucleotidyltransferase (CCA-adding enzyme)